MFVFGILFQSIANKNREKSTFISITTNDIRAEQDPLGGIDRLHGLNPLGNRAAASHETSGEVKRVDPLGSARLSHAIGNPPQCLSVSDRMAPISPLVSNWGSVVNSYYTRIDRLCTE